MVELRSVSRVQICTQYS